MMCSVKDFKWENKSVDELGKVFHDNDFFYRGIYNKKNVLRRVKRMFQKGVIDILVKEKMILPIEVVDVSFADSDEFGMVLKSKRIENVIFPTEWSYSMLLRAAKQVLKMEKILLKYGYTLVDYHPYNIVYDGGNPYWVDLGSIAMAKEESERVFATYVEQIYYRPLFVWNQKKNSSTECYLPGRGMKIDDKSWNTYLYGFWGGEIIGKISNAVWRKKRSIELIEQKINVLPFWGGKKTETHHLDWSEYQSGFFSGNGQVKDNERFRNIANYLQKYNIHTITELAANQGAFSQLCVEEKIVEHSLAIDYDEWAVDKMFCRLMERKLPITCGVVDITAQRRHDCNAVSRMKNEAVVAMALTHHLILSQGLSIEKTLDIICAYGEKYVFVEFMPLGLYSGSQVVSKKRLPPSYTLGNFRKAFQERCVVREELEVEKNRILFVGELM